LKIFDLAQKLEKNFDSQYFLIGIQILAKNIDKSVFSRI
jgi:hypothetical protein